MSKFYDGIIRIFAKACRAAYRVEIRGIENIPADGPVILCANHTAFSDVIVIAASVPRQVRFLAKAEIFKIPLIRHFFRGMGAVPLHRGKADLQALRTTLSLLSENQLVGIFPQGHRFPGADLRNTPVQSGVGMIAYRSHATVVPAAIITKAKKLHIFRKTILSIGRPISFEEWNYTGGTPSEYQRVAEMIFSHIADLAEGQEA